MERSLDEKPFLVFGTPRSGSSILYETVAFYLARTRNVSGLGEYFCIKAGEFYDAGHGIGWQPWTDRVPHDIEILNHRLDWLIKYHGRYCLKVFPLHSEGIALTPRHWTHLTQNYEWIFVERRNLFEQALSFAIAVATGVWVTQHQSNLQERSLKASLSAPFVLARSIADYTKLRANLPAANLLYYEDLLENPRGEATMRRLGFHEPADFSDFHGPKKQNIGDKLRFLSNPDEFIRSYRESFLNVLFPV
jgi:hypothetical protein